MVVVCTSAGSIAAVFPTFSSPNIESVDHSEMWKFYWSFLRFHLLQQQKHRKKGYQPNIYLREWAIKTELKYRARIYDPQEHDEHKSIEKREYQQPNSSGGFKAAAAVVEKEDGLDKDKPVEDASEAAAEEDDENKSSLANFSNQMVISIGKFRFRYLSLYIHRPFFS